MLRSGWECVIPLASVTVDLLVMEIMTAHQGSPTWCHLGIDQLKLPPSLLLGHDGWDWWEMLSNIWRGHHLLFQCIDISSSVAPSISQAAYLPPSFSRQDSGKAASLWIMWPPACHLAARIFISSVVTFAQGLIQSAWMYALFITSPQQNTLL